MRNIMPAFAAYSVSIVKCDEEDVPLPGLSADPGALQARWQAAAPLHVVWEHIVRKPLQKPRFRSCDRLLGQVVAKCIIDNRLVDIQSASLRVCQHSRDGNKAPSSRPGCILHSGGLCWVACRASFVPSYLSGCIKGLRWAWPDVSGSAPLSQQWLRSVDPEAWALMKRRQTRVMQIVSFLVWLGSLEIRFFTPKQACCVVIVCCKFRSHQGPCFNLSGGTCL